MILFGVFEFLENTFALQNVKGKFEVLNEKNG